MSRISRFVSGLIVFVAVIGFNTSHVNAAMECFHQENSRGVYEERYGYYCAGTGAGCSFCWDEVVVQG